MQDLHSFFINPITKKYHSYGDKQRFSEEHIGRLSAQNTHGQYDAMLQATLQVHSDYFGDFTQVKVAEAVRQSLTQMVDKVIADFVARTSRLHSFLVATEVNKLPIYEEFFPNGVTEFTQGTTKTNADSHIDRLIATITAHTPAAGGAAVLTEYTDFKTKYEDARKAQLLKKGDTEGSRSSRDEKGTLWADQLFGNLLTLAFEYRNHPEKLSDFFDQSILRPKGKAK